MSSSIDEYYQFIEQFPNWKPNSTVQQFLDSHLKGELVESVDVNALQEYHSWNYFHATRSVLGFVTPTLEWARSLKKVIGEETVLEVGAGTGLVAKYLNHVGINIIATDDYSWHKKDFNEWKSFIPVENLDFKEAIRKYKADYLLLCWPMYADALAREAAELFTELNPNGKIIYIGEGHGGCTGNDAYHEGIVYLDQLDEVNKVYPQWSGLHDYCSLVKWIKNTN